MWQCILNASSICTEIDAGGRTIQRFKTMRQCRNQRVYLPIPSIKNALV